MTPTCLPYILFTSLGLIEQLNFLLKAGVIIELEQHIISLHFNFSWLVR